MVYSTHIKYTDLHWVLVWKCLTVNSVTTPFHTHTVHSTHMVFERKLFPDNVHNGPSNMASLLQWKRKVIILSICTGCLSGERLFQEVNNRGVLTSVQLMIHSSNPHVFSNSSLIHPFIILQRSS